MLAKGTGYPWTNVLVYPGLTFDENVFNFSAHTQQGPFVKLLTLTLNRKRTVPIITILLVIRFAANQKATEPSVPIC